MSLVIAILLYCFVMFLFGGIFYLVFLMGTTKPLRRQLWGTRWKKLVLVGVVFVGFLATLYSVSRNDFVYYWDYGGYWTSSYTQANDYFRDPIGTLDKTYDTIIDSDYNLILPTLVSLPLKVFGYSFTRYVMVNYFLFLVPAFLIVFVVVYKIFLRNDKKAIRKRTWWVALFSACSFVVVFTPMLKGYIDVAALIPIGLSILLFVNYNPTLRNRKTLQTSVLMGLLLLVTFLFRRYFAFYIVGYAVALLIYVSYLCFSVKNGFKLKKRALLNGMLNMLIIGGVALLILVVFFNGLITRILSNNYSEQYSAYDAPLGEKVFSLAHRFGLIIVGFSILGIIGSFLTRRNRKLVGFCVVSILITVFGFFRVQRMDLHHTYAIVLQALLLFSLGVYYTFQLRPGNILTYAVLALLVLEPINYFVPSAWFDGASFLFVPKYQPMYRSDIQELHNLSTFIKDLQGNSGKPVYILASGNELNSSIVDSLDKPQRETAIQNLQHTSDVDLRDGFPVGFLKSNIVVTTNPVQLHLKDKSQMVVEYLHDEIMNDSSYIGRHYQRNEKTFTLDNGVEVIIFQKKSNFSDEDLHRLADYYDGLYPNHKELFGERILAEF